MRKVSHRKRLRKLSQEISRTYKSFIEEDRRQQLKEAYFRREIHRLDQKVNTKPASKGPILPGLEDENEEDDEEVIRLISRKIDDKEYDLGA